MKFYPILLLTLLSCSQAVQAATPKYQALQFSPIQSGSTWAVLERDGASRQVEPYLSSLGWGESGVGEIISPNFTVQSDSITFTIRGHDGPQNDSKLNSITLLDPASGQPLRQTFAPGSDDLQERSWDVKDLAGKTVRISLRDADQRTAYAWFGVGQIAHGANILADFKNGLPDDWTAPITTVELETQLLRGPIPFNRVTSAYSMVPADQNAEIPCNFTAEQLFLLGCTIAGAKPLEIPGHIEIVYTDGSFDRLPLLVGFNLDGEDKLLSRAQPMRLHASRDPFQHFVAITPKPKPIEKIILAKSSRSQATPRITAITALTTDQNENLTPLPNPTPTPRLKRWIQANAIPSSGPENMPEIVEQICLRHKLPTPAVHFTKTRISNRTFEAASAFDVDLDGHIDLVCGGFWYAGPDFNNEIKITDVTPAGEYWEDFSDFPMDVNGDGLTDIVTGAFFGEPLRWLQNPGKRGADWNVHPIENVGAIETTRFWDVDGDGFPEIAPNAGGNVVFFRLVRDAQGKGTGAFTKHVVKLGGCGHGLGFGDVNGDGRGDFIVPTAWIEAPENPLTDPWIWHDDRFNLESASVPVLVHDVNEDGKADLIVGQAHAFGLDWWEQNLQPDGTRGWIRHAIETSSSQYHDLALADIDNDDKPELVTGKRYRAHNGHDPGARDPLVIRYFDIDVGAFSQHVIDYGPADTTSGLGIYFWIEDVNSDGWQDIVAPGKEGLFLFTNLGLEKP